MSISREYFDIFFVMYGKISPWIFLLLILAIGCIQSKKLIRSFVVIQEKAIKGKPITNFTVFDSTGKVQLYRLRSSVTDMDEMMVVEYPAKNMIANAEGEWIDGKVNVTFSIYEKKLGKWIEGNIQRRVQQSPEDYRIEWNNQTCIIRVRWYTKTIKIYKERPEELIADFRHRARWLNKLKYNYDLKIYSDKLPDALYLLALNIMHHKDRSKTSKN